MAFTPMIASLLGRLSLACRPSLLRKRKGQILRRTLYVHWPIRHCKVQRAATHEHFVRNVGLFGLDKLHNVDRTVATLEKALSQVTGGTNIR